MIMPNEIFFIFQAIGLVIHVTYFFCTILTDVPLRHHISQTAEYTAIITYIFFIVQKISYLMHLTAVL